MTQPRDSLGGQNSPGRRSGARSSRALSTKLFKRLQKLDRQIAALDSEQSCFLFHMDGRRLVKRNKLDDKRKEVRNQRKALGNGVRP